MCLGNRAKVASDYVNGQLRTLYENAQHCARHHGTGLKPSKEMVTVEYATCLAEFYGPGKHSRQHPSTKDLSFFAKFGQPRIEFICNHEIIFKINIQEGHYNLEGQKSNATQEDIVDCTIAFRIAFNTHIEKLQSRFIGNGDEHVTTILVLDMGSACFLLEHSISPDISDVSKLASYLSSYYLPLLARAGHHVLYSLPDFDNLAVTTAFIDYSFLREDSIIVDKIYDISVKDINMHLRGLWFQAYSHVSEYGVQDDNIAQTFLSETRFPALDCNERPPFRLVLGPMGVRLLCSKELILDIDVQDAQILDATGSSIELAVEDVKLAYIVGIKYSEHDNGGSKQIELDFTNEARFCEHLSDFTNCSVARIKNILVGQAGPQLIKMLEKTNNTTIYYHDESIHVQDGDIEDDTHVPTTTPEFPTEPEGPYWSKVDEDILNNSRLGTSDLVMALTQHSINSHFKDIWMNACRRYQETNKYESESSLAYFVCYHPETMEELFKATFLEPKVQLICEKGSKSVILYITLDEGELKPLGPEKTLQPEAESYPFSQWRLAFEVKLDIEDSPEEIIQSTIHNRLDHQQEAGFKQLVLRLDTAKFKLKLSTIPGLLEGSDYRLTFKRFEALVYYIQYHYFTVLTHEYHHILYWIPENFSRLSQLKDLEIQFDIVPFVYSPGAPPRQGLRGKDSYIFERNAILIRCITERSAMVIEDESATECMNWVSGSGKDVPYGSICLSNEVFLKKALFPVLERVNRETTIVPTFSGVIDGQWIIELTTWGDANAIKPASCGCVTQQLNDEGSLDFVYRNRDYWAYEHEGCSNNGCYSIESITRNVFSLPTCRTETPELKIRGEVKLVLSFQTPSSQQKWSADMAVTWETGVSLISATSGLQAVLHQPTVVPNFQKGHVEQNANSVVYATMFDKVRKIFPTNVDCGEFVKELNMCLSGSWPGVRELAHDLRVAHPVFNKRGDLFLELAVQSEPPMGLAY